jgi:hypothetical protein
MENKVLVDGKAVACDTIAVLKMKVTSLEAGNGNLEVDKTNLMDELAATCGRLDDQCKITADLLDQLEADTNTHNQVKSVMLLWDKASIAAKPFLCDDKYKYTLCKTINMIEDITLLIENKVHLQNIMSHDKVVILAGIGNIVAGENGREVAAKMLAAAEKVYNKSGTPVAIIAIPPTKSKQGHALLFNSRLEKANVGGIEFIKLEELARQEKIKILLDDYNLNPYGAQMLVKTVEDMITLTDGEKMTVLPTKTSMKCKEKEPPADSESESDEELLEEIISIRNEDVGKIIGSHGARVRAIMAKTGANVFLDKIEVNGEKKWAAFIKGSDDGVKAAKKEIIKIQKEKKNKDRSSAGASPRGKRLKKNR